MALGGDVEAVTMFESVQTVSSRLAPWDAVVACAAGPIAAQCLGSGWRTLARVWSPQNRAVATLNIERAGLPVTAEAFERAERAARRQVSEHAKSIRKVAEALRAAADRR